MRNPKKTLFRFVPQSRDLGASMRPSRRFLTATMSLSPSTSVNRESRWQKVEQMKKDRTKVFTLGHSPTRTTRSCFMGWRRIRLICAVMGLTIDSKIFRY